MIHRRKVNSNKRRVVKTRPSAKTEDNQVKDENDAREKDFIQFMTKKSEVKKDEEQVERNENKEEETKKQELTGRQMFKLKGSLCFFFINFKILIEVGLIREVI